MRATLERAPVKEPPLRHARALCMPERLALALEHAGPTNKPKLPSPRRPSLSTAPGPRRWGRTDADAQAGAFGPDLASLLAGLRPPGARWPLPRWTSLERPGWRFGGQLGLACEDCGLQLGWADWWSAAAVRMRNNAFVFCPSHGGPLTHHVGKKLERLVWARQQLDSSVYPPGKGQAQYVVYAYEVLGLGRAAVYVGETTKSVEDRYAEHVRGIRSPQIIRGGRGVVGPLRADLVTGLPPLTSQTAALSAQHWAHLSLLHQSFVVYGDGKR